MFPATMSDQSEGSTNNGEPPPTPLQYIWLKPLTVSVPLGRDDDDTAGPGIDMGRLRDSLELPKYQPPNPLGVRRLSHASAAAAGAAPRDGEGSEDPKMPELISAAEDREHLNVALTSMVLKGGYYSGRRSRGPSHALNVVQPYPTMTAAGRKRPRCPSSPTLDPFPERLLKKVARSLSLSSPPDGAPEAACEPLDEDAKKGEEAAVEEVNPAAAAALAEVLALRFSTIVAWLGSVAKGKDKAEDNAVPAQEAGGAAQQEVTAEADGEEDNDWELVAKEDLVPNMPQVAAAAAHEEAHDGK